MLPASSCSEDRDTAPFHDGCYTELAPGDDGLRILFIGNSLTYWHDVGGILAGLFAQADVSFNQIETLAKPNYGLQDHWTDPSVHATLAEGWDVVILQQGPSATEGRPSLLEYSKKFAGEIRATGGEPGLFMVWPAKVRFFDFNGVSDSYAAAADSVDGWLFPAGEAWLAAWDRDPDLPLYGPDAFHPSPRGAYLAAVVMFEQLSGVAAGILNGAFCPTGEATVQLSAAEAAVLHAAASEANAAFARPVP